jgi:hypothetical protein
MAMGEDEERSYRIKGLSDLQSGFVFIIIASLLALYVAYQIMTGRVFTKTGELPLGSGLSWPFLTIESVAAIVGIVRGVKMIRR